MDYVRDEILKTLEEVKTKPVTAERLAAVKSNLKYSFALGMNSTESVADTLADFIQLNPDPETINRLYETYDRITPDDIVAMAKKYFTVERRTVATLSYTPAATGEGQ
jgi:zinc protease